MEAISGDIGVSLTPDHRKKEESKQNIVTRVHVLTEHCYQSPHVLTEYNQQIVHVLTKTITSVLTKKTKVC